MKPAHISDEAWAEAVAKASKDEARLARLVKRRLVVPEGMSHLLHRTQPRAARVVDPTIRPNKKKRGKRR